MAVGIGESLLYGYGQKRPCYGGQSPCVVLANTLTYIDYTPDLNLRDAVYVYENWPWLLQKPLDPGTLLSKIATRKEFHLPPQDGSRQKFKRISRRKR